MNYLEKLQSARTTEDFGKLLGFKAGNISYLLYHYPGIKYYTFQIPKKNGTFRIINAPQSQLKCLQKRLSDYLYKCLSEIRRKNSIVDKVSYGFQEGKSIYNNAVIHQNRRYVFNVDLKDFFSSISFGRVRGYFIKNKNFQLDPHIATLIAQTACFENKLPQGSPLSPVITILLGGILDNRVLQLTRKVKCSYSRYVDDLTFSTNKKSFPKEIAVRDNDGNWSIGKDLWTIISQANYEPNEQKILMQYRDSRQLTVGLIVNRKINVPHEYYKTVRAMCYSLIKNGTYTRNDFLSDEKPTLNQLQGMLNYIFFIKSHNVNTKSKGQIQNFQKIYIDFLLYRFFFANEKPIIFTEGKTDIIYLKCALRKLRSEYPQLINPDGTYNIQFICLNDYLQKVFCFCPGTGGLHDLLRNYECFLKRFKKEKSTNPVAFLFDHDSGLTKIINHYKNYESCKSYFSFDVFPSLSVEVYPNLYFLFTHREKDGYIELLFDENVRNQTINGKAFTSENNVHNPQNYYGKQVFAAKVIKANYKSIDFTKFKPLLTEMVSIFFHK